MKNTDALNIRDVDGGCIMAVKVVPGASRDRVVGVLGECLKVTVATAAQKGRANVAVAKLLAGAVGVAPRDVTLSAGQTSPRKEFRISGASAQEVRSTLRDT